MNVLLRLPYHGAVALPVKQRCDLPGQTARLLLTGGAGADQLRQVDFASHTDLQDYISELMSKAVTESLVDVTKIDKLFSLVLADKAAERRVRARVDRALAAGAKLFPKGRDYYGPGHQAQIDDFVRAVRAGSRPYVTFADAAESDAMVFAAYASASRKDRRARRKAR